DRERAVGGGDGDERGAGRIDERAEEVFRGARAEAALNRAAVRSARPLQTLWTLGSPRAGDGPVHRRLRRLARIVRADDAYLLVRLLNAGMDDGRIAAVSTGNGRERPD